MAPASSKESLDIQTTIECGRSKNIHRAWHGRNIQPQWPVRSNSWVFVYELSGCWFECCGSHLNFRYRACFEQGVPWHSYNYRVWMRSKTRTWHDPMNIESNIVHFYDHQMSIVKHFSVNSIKSEFGNKEKVEFYWFFITSNISDMRKVCEIRANTSSVSLFETFVSNWPLIYNYHETIKQWDKRNILWRMEMNV